MERFTGSNDGEIYSIYTCKTCTILKNYIDKNNDDAYDEDFVLEDMANNNFQGTPEEYLKELEDA